MDIMLLFAVLGIIVNLFTISGWLYSELERKNLFLIIVLGFLLAFFRLGLPPPAVYIVASEPLVVLQKEEF